MKLTLLATLALLSLVMAQCPANYAIPNLVADSVQFTVTQPRANSSQTYQYTLNQPLPSTPAVAIAVQDFSIVSVGPHAFYIAPSQTSSSKIVFGFAYTAPIWSKIRFNFWASANSQIQLGTFSAVNLAVSGNSATVSTSLQQPFSQNDNPVIRAFINGYMSWGNGVQIAVAPSNLQGSTLSFTLMFGPGTNVTSAWISFIAFSPSTASFSAYGGSLNRASFSGSLTNDVSNSLYQTPYILFGLTQISLSGQTPLDYACSINPNFQLNLASSRNFDSFGIAYIIAGNSPSKLCSSCGNGFVAYGNTCVSSCPLGTSQFTYKDGGIACIGTAVTSSSSRSTSTTSQSHTHTTSSQAQASTSQTQAASSQTQATVSSTQPSSRAQATSTQTISQSIQQSATQASSRSVSGSASSGSSQIQASPSAGCPKNSFFNGYQCVCEVGFGFINGNCVPLSISQPIPVIINMGVPTAPSSTATASAPAASSPASSSTGQKSTVSAATTASSAGSAPITQSPNAIPKSSTPTSCPANSYDNGLGTCVCSTGFYFDGQQCTQGTPCPAGSTRQSDGSCKCDAGLTNYGGYCSRCPNGAIWSAQTQTCIFVCGQNSVYNSTVGSCVCNPGFGLINGQCSNCPNNYYISQGYCVTCPVNSAYNQAKNTCDCLNGFFTNELGICTQKCSTNEVYSIAIQNCVCMQGLGRINGACTICPTGSVATADGSGCSSCRANEELINGRCACKAGFAYNSAQVCTICSQLPNGFLINGVCSVCPRNMVYNGNNGCGCPAGRILQGASCVSQCQPDEILDSQGNCYTCGNNQVISNGRCVCRTGYSPNSCGNCVLACSPGQFSYQGGCAVCPLNTVFNTQINGCSCPDGYYKDINGICAQVVLRPVDCPSGQYFDNTNGCVACPGSCRTCKSATQCTTCATTGFSPNAQGACVPTCGDGLILGAETCDTGNTYSSGCINCQIQPGFTCSGQPSVCRAPNSVSTPTTGNTGNAGSTGNSGSTSPSGSSNTGSTATPTSPPVASNLAPLYQSGSATINSNNVFVTLKTNPTFTFSSPTDMQNFISTRVASGAKPTVYCSQRPNPNLDTFDCLMIYPSGVPNSQFSVDFSYNYQGKTGSVTVSVDPFAVSNNRRPR